MRKTQKIVYTLFLVVIVGSANAIYITRMISMPAYKEVAIVFDILLVIRGLTKIGIDIYLFGTFLQVFRYFIEKKRQQSIAQYNSSELSGYNQMIIYWTYFLFWLNVLSSALIAVVWGIFQSSFVQFSDAKKDPFFRITMQPVTWMINFLTCTGLLYLFHFQGRKTLSQRISATESNLNTLITNRGERFEDYEISEEL